MLFLGTKRSRWDESKRKGKEEEKSGVEGGKRK